MKVQIMFVRGMISINNYWFLDYHPVPVQISRLHDCHPCFQALEEALVIDIRVDIIK